LKRWLLGIVTPGGGFILKREPRRLERVWLEKGTAGKSRVGGDRQRKRVIFEKTLREVGHVNVFEKDTKAHRVLGLGGK